MTLSGSWEELELKKFNKFLICSGVSADTNISLCCMITYLVWNISKKISYIVYVQKILPTLKFFWVS